MDITELSKRIYAFQKKNIESLGEEMTPELVFMHLSEEIGEISRELINRRIPLRKYKEEGLKEEVAQALLDILVLAELVEVDLPKELERKMADMQKRAAENDPAIIAKLRRRKRKAKRWGNKDNL